MARTLAALTALRYIFTEGLTPRLKDSYQAGATRRGAVWDRISANASALYIRGAVYPPSVAQLKEALSTAIPDKEGELMHRLLKPGLKEGRREGREEGLREGVAATVLRQIHTVVLASLDAETTYRIRVPPHLKTRTA